MNRKNIRLRYEKPSDYTTVEQLTREAFWNRYRPGCTEHYLLHILRDSDCFLPGLDIIAEHRGRIVGSIVYTKAKLFCDNGETKEVLTFGPVSVLPSYQKNGIGSLLVGHTKELAGRMGYKAILIYGDPEYYGRFGFLNAERYGIGTQDNLYADGLQALELFPGALYGCAGGLRRIRFIRSTRRPQRNSTASLSRRSCLRGFRLRNASARFPLHAGQEP